MITQFDHINVENGKVQKIRLRVNQINSDKLKRKKSKPVVEKFMLPDLPSVIVTSGAKKNKHGK